MILNAAQRAVIEDRRRLVASMLLRKATQREIAKALEAQKSLNPDTGEPWSIGTINSDVQALKRDWRKEARQSIELHRARQIAELDEVMREGWTLKDLQAVLKALKQQSDLLGLNAPIQQEQVTVALTLAEWRKQSSQARTQASQALNDFSDDDAPE